MADLADVRVPDRESDGVEADQKVQQWIEESARIGCGTEAAGFERNEDEPQGCGDPGFEDLLLRWIQLRASRWKLLDSIVRSLAGDYNVVYMALPQARDADAHEASFLQQFGNAAASAITHA